MNKLNKVLDPETAQAILTLRTLLKNRGMNISYRSNRKRLYLYLNCSRWAGTEKVIPAYETGTKIIQEMFPDAYLTSASHPDGRYVFRAIKGPGKGRKG
jgi:hypothetical protein